MRNVKAFGLACVLALSMVFAAPQPVAQAAAECDWRYVRDGWYSITTQNRWEVDTFHYNFYIYVCPDEAVQTFDEVMQLYFQTNGQDETDWANAYHAVMTITFLDHLSGPYIIP